MVLLAPPASQPNIVSLRGEEAGVFLDGHFAGKAAAGTAGRTQQNSMERIAMDKTELRSARGEAHWEPKYPFDLVVAYEDISTRNQALRLYDSIASQLLDDYDFQCSWWKLDFLQSQPLFDQAADAAAESNMLVLSLRESQQLPEIVERWSEAIIQRRDYRKTALVALICNLAPDKSHSAPVVTALHRFAHQANMDFFCNTFQLPRETTAISFDRIDARVHTVTPLLNEILHHRMPFPRGINE